ncbi:hypothetical protein KCP73_23080 [Salmonella enterica subsp. enterica]|nr:hypothetical protein KCP73_23080 [Salmonella enterica subsp. enterica]
MNRSSISRTPKILFNLLLTYAKVKSKMHRIDLRRGISGYRRNFVERSAKCGAALSRCAKAQR